MTDDTTEPDTRGSEPDTPEHRTLGDVSHTNPHTGTPFGATQTYARGTQVAADGGERDATDPGRSTDGEDRETMEDVDHTPPEDTQGANRAYERGHEGRQVVR